MAGRLHQVFINHKANIHETNINSGTITLLNRNIGGQHMLKVKENAESQFLITLK